MADGFYKTTTWQKLRARTVRLWRASGKPCAYCGKPFEPGQLIFVDHIKNRRQFPALALDPRNLCCVHRDCNTKKAAYYENNAREAVGIDGLPPSWT